ncbi:MAG: M3 family oligoendopeptidase [Rhodothermales bacterium]
MPKERPTGAEAITWDLTDLYTDGETAIADLGSTGDKARMFAEQWAGRIASATPDAFAVALAAYAELQDATGRAYTYAYLAWSANTADPAAGKLLQNVKERYTAIASTLLFFELEWSQMDDTRAHACLEHPGTGMAKHWLTVLREQKQYLLSEPEERIVLEKSLSGRSAWNRFFDETMGAMRFSLDGEEVTQQQVLSKLHDADASLRKSAAAAFTEGLQKHNRTLTFIFNTILQDKATEDRLRGYPSWISARNLSNEVADGDVEALVEAVTGSYGHVRRFYRLKARLLGLDVLNDYDRYAPVGEADKHIPWDEARRLVTESYAAFHPELGAIVDQFFEQRWIDAALHPSKRGGAFSHGAVPSAHPYILMNYTGKVRDVQTLAHELGHGVHQYLSREQGIFHADTPLTTAETASVFGEMLVFQRLLASESDPSNRLAMLMGKIDDTMATVYRQVTMNRFEDRIHTMRREEGELGADQFSDAWMETQSAMYGDSVTLTNDYRWWWSYIPHFLHTPGYVYAYAFGELLVLALYQRYTSSGDDFPDRYRELLAAGGSDWPHELVGKMGIDLRDASFWKAGVDMIGRLVDEAETLAQTIVER